MRRSAPEGGDDTAEAAPAASGAKVGNPIYDTVRAGLADLVSDRAADAVLARGLAAAGTDAERVDLPRMSRMLRGVVRRELERTLPRAGVRKRLAALDRTLHDSAAADGRCPCRGRG